MTQILELPTEPEIRAQIQAAVARDLLGPAGGPEEIVNEPNVRGRYLLGLLAPRGQTPLPASGDDDQEEDPLSVAPEEAEELAVAGVDTEEGATEAPRPKAASMLPSSIGLTFTLAPTAKAVRVWARWGKYHRITKEQANLPDSHVNPWKREPVEGGPYDIPLRHGNIAPWSPDSISDVQVSGRIRRYTAGWTVTLYLVNKQPEPSKNKDAAWVFQPELIVKAVDQAGNEAPLFRKVLSRDEDLNHVSAEERRLRMMYRKQVEFAVGHGVAVHAEKSEDAFDAAVSLQTVVIPSHELWPTIPVPVAGAQLGMKALAQASGDALRDALQPLLMAYAGWIDAREDEVNAAPADLLPYLQDARDALAGCRDALRRMGEGLQTLLTDAQAAEAFRFANEAMWIQRMRTQYTQSMRKSDERVPFEQFKPDNEPAWRAFQIAFILINIASLADPLHPDRNRVADVLWFPTGGGKTEAYLGLTAFTLALRRLQGNLGGYDGSAGVAVLMRYTLRLLTLQQFQRATTLICACEELRRLEPAKWGEEPFRIGLWVGQASTPNTNADSDQKVKEIRRQAGYTAGSTPHQLTSCPYCGNPIHPGNDIAVETLAAGRCRTLIFCSDPTGECLFCKRGSAGEGLPVLVVDEEIYRRLPALLIATVDKFAQLPWKGETQMLFGKVNGFCPRHGFRSPEIEDSDSHPATRDRKFQAVRTQPAGPLRPPDLIIQDELHLINGPLGTLVGLYETVIDSLSTWQVNGQAVKPKIIASSATIRKADAQVAALYTREARVFPPPALDAADSFFAKQVAPDKDRPGRLYVGVCAPGSQMRSLLIRLYAVYLSAAMQAHERVGDLADPWMTLVGYFNSLRELGGMRRATEDAVAVRLRRMNQRLLPTRMLNQYGIEELTSRKSAADIPTILDKLELPFKLPPSARERGDAARAGGGQRHIDVLLATNMISVGVDVARLGLMVVANQPKNTAEYIQATSRIGRAHPGLVCTAFNWARPRDLSHYERFEHYHCSFYQQVEALTVTPFSPRALDRGLTALLVSELRLTAFELNANEGANRLTRDNPLVAQAIDTIVQRAMRVSGDTAVAADVRQMLERDVNIWLNEIQKKQSAAGVLGYKKEGERTVNLLKTAESQATHLREPFTCLNSLRDVEPSVNLVLMENLRDDV
jgi:hypothetical protein